MHCVCMLQKTVFKLVLAVRLLVRPEPSLRCISSNTMFGFRPSASCSLVADRHRTALQDMGTLACQTSFFFLLQA